MKLQLKNIKRAKFTSYGVRYQAVLCVNGKPFAEIGDNGNGESVGYFPVDFADDTEFNAQLQNINSWLAANEPSLNGTKPCDIELWCGRAIEQHLNKKAA